jgi:spermidine synthase
VVTRRTDLGVAEIVPEPGKPWRVTLRLDDEDCSFVDLRDPRRLEFAYVRRLGDAVDVVAPPRVAIDAVHLGGGGFTLPRYVAATRSGSRQEVAEPDAALVALAREHLGLRTGGGLRVRTADGLDLLRRRRPVSADLVVLDAFVGRTTPPHLLGRDLAEAAARVLRPSGIFAANVIDDPPLPQARALAVALRERFSDLAVVAARKVLRGRIGGNVVLVASASPLPAEALRARAARGYAPELLLAGEDARRFAR